MYFGGAVEVIRSLDEFDVPRTKAEPQGRALAILHITVPWFSSAEYQTVNSAVKGLVAIMQREAEEPDALDPFLYINCAAPWQRPIISYDEDNLERLRDVQVSYDPEPIFTHRVPGGLKIPTR